MKEDEKKMEEEAAAKHAPMKFSFLSKAKPPLARHPNARFPGQAQSAEAVEFVTEFDGKGRKAAASGVKVIPKLENSWRPEKRMKNIEMEIEPALHEDRFEMETLSVGPHPDITYGLTLTLKPEKPDLLLAQTDRPSRAQLEDQKLKDDLTDLPDEEPFDAYDAMPVEEFGEALLRGLGWEKGQPIGRNSTAAVAPLEIARRIGREGLGAVPASSLQGTQHAGLPPPPAAREERRNVNERVTDVDLEGRCGIGITPGKIMAIIRGAYAGSRGKVVETKKSEGRSYERVYIRLLETGEKVRVKSDEVAEIGSMQEETARKQIAELEIDDTKQRTRGHQSESRRDGPDRDHKEKDRVVEIDDKKQGKDRDSRRQGRDSFDNDGAPLDRWKEKAYGKTRERDLDETNNRKHSNHKEERSADCMSRRYDPRKEDRGKETSKRESVLSVTGEGYHKSLKTVDILEKPSKDKDRNTARMSFEKEDRKRYASWLRSHIRVRIISKSLHRGALYLKKGHIADVSGPNICDIIMDEDGTLIQEVKQEQLETSLPRKGGRVVVVGGKHRGLTGRLLERDSKKEVALVQTEEDFETLTLSLNDVAEFVEDAV